MNNVLNGRLRYHRFFAIFTTVAMVLEPIILIAIILKVYGDFDYFFGVLREHYHLNLDEVTLYIIFYTCVVFCLRMLYFHMARRKDNGVRMTSLVMCFVITGFHVVITGLYVARGVHGFLFLLVCWHMACAVFYGWTFYYYLLHRAIYIPKKVKIRAQASAVQTYEANLDYDPVYGYVEDEK